MPRRTFPSSRTAPHAAGAGCDSARIRGIVLGCGIVSVDLYSHHQPVLSAIMLWFAAGVWLLLAVILSMRLAYQRDRFGREARSPAAFTGAYLETCGGWRRHAEPGLFEVPCS